MLSITVTCGAGFALSRLALAETGEATSFLWELVPGIMFGSAFFPQYYEFISLWSVEGYSVAVSACDILGSTANTIVIVAPAGIKPSEAALQALPFIIVLICEGLLLMINIVIRRTGSRKLVLDDKAGIPKPLPDPGHTAKHEVNRV